MKPKFIIILLIAIAPLKFACTPEPSSDQGVEIFPLYIGADVELRQSGLMKTVPVIDDYVHADRNLTLRPKIELLLEQLSARYFNNLSIELKDVQATGSVRILHIDLVENPAYQGPGSLQPYESWYDFFQGSHGGQNTQIILTESLLQRHHQGDWIDALVVFYQGEEFGDFDHINLTRTIFRYE